MVAALPRGEYFYAKHMSLNNLGSLLTNLGNLDCRRGLENGDG